MGIMQLTENITVLAIILTGAALIREREHGTIEHLLVMPVTPFEIMCAKISPSTHFVQFTQSVLFRGAEIDLVWRHLLAIGGIGCVLFGVAWLAVPPGDRDDLGATRGHTLQDAVNGRFAIGGQGFCGHNAFRMTRQVVSQGQLQREFVHQIAARTSGCNIVADHTFDVAAAVRGLHKVVTKLGGHHHGKMLVLRNCSNLFLGQGAQGNAILNR